jgi:hypothetical protein
MTSFTFAQVAQQKLTASSLSMFMRFDPEAEVQ